MTDKTVNNYAKLIGNNFNAFKKLTNIVNFDDSNIELNTSITNVIDENIILIDKVNEIKPGYYDEEAIIQLKDDRKDILTNEETIVVPVVDKLTVSLELTMEYRLSIERSAEDVEFRYSNIPGLSVLGNNEFLNLLLINDEIDLIENPSSISSTLIKSTYERLETTLRQSKESKFIDFERKEDKLDITFKLYKLHPYFEPCHNISISLQINETDSVLLKENLNKIKDKILTIALLLRNLRTY